MEHLSSEIKKISHHSNDAKNSSETTEKASIIMEHLSEINKVYHIVPKVIGTGRPGNVVRECIHLESNKSYAVKSIDKKIERLSNLQRELECLRQVNHSSIIKFVEAFEDEVHIHFVTEICRGGDVHSRLWAKSKTQEKGYDEFHVAGIIQKVLEGVAYCHDVKQICHRDLKPENTLFTSLDEDSDIRIIDFGLSCIFTTNEAIKGIVGSSPFLAPEVQLGKNYDESCDLWSLGVMSFEVLSGHHPFHCCRGGKEDKKATQEAIESGKHDFTSPRWDKISAEAKHFVASLLKMDPKERPTASQALSHEWFACVGAKVKVKAMRSVSDDAEEGDFDLEEREEKKERDDDGELVSSAKKRKPN